KVLQSNYALLDEDSHSALYDQLGMVISGVRNKEFMIKRGKHKPHLIERKGPKVFKRDVIFKDDVTFKDDVKFKDDVTFKDEVSFQDKVVFNDKITVKGKAV